MVHIPDTGAGEALVFALALLRVSDVGITDLTG